MNPIKERKPIKYLAVENISFDHLACTNSRFFHNRHLSIILNDKPLNTASLQKEIIYHVAEARLILILKGCVEGNLNLEDQYIEQGHVLLLPADSIMELMYFQHRSATLSPSLLWSVAEKERGGEESHQCKIKKGAFSLEDSHESSNFVLKYEVQSPDRSAKIRNFSNPSKGYIYSFHRKTHRCTSLNGE